MKTKNRLLASVLCLLTVVFCVVGLTACGGDDECSHQWGEWSITKNATCTEAGTQERECSECGETETSTLSALGHEWEEATCSTPKTCKNCSATEGTANAHAYTVEAVKDEALKSAANCASAAIYYKSCSCGAISTNDADTFTSGSALAHTDANKDHECDRNCGENIGTCEDADKDHGCDYGCDKTFGTCGDADFDHACDYGCDKVLGTCEDLNKDHECDHGCEKTFGEHSDSSTDGDHVCDYGCQAVIEACSDADNDGNHTCDVCGNADISSHSYGNATCGAPATCSECGATTGSTLEHKDENHDHICDNGCGKNDMGVHADSSTDGDHVCDYGCKAVLENCSDVEADDDHDCDVCGKENVTAHAHVENASLATEATCEAAATKTYECNCGHKYKEDVGDALGHDITGVEATERHVNGCEYVLVYVCQRGGCGNEVLGETVYHHNYVASIKTPATCTTPGEKTFECSTCGDTSKAAEPIPADATGHNWTTGDVVDGVRTDTCSVCSQTKTVTVYVGNKTDEVKAEDLADKEIELNDANISLDSGVIDTIGDQNVTVSADKIEGDDRTDLGLSKDQLAQVGDSPIYNFTINNGTENISDFGEENYVTITLPYTLAEGEDVDSIAVWFINDKGELESIKATYNNGYVTFKTNHFSYYTVTRLTPAERCALYGHGYVCQHVEGSCTKDAYDLYVCVRCHDKYIDEGTLVIADGHDYSSETYDATCTENGYVLYTCNDCNHSYRTKINATGHSWSEIDSGEVSCTADGFVKYGCDGCDEEYIVTYVKTGHVYTDTVVPATCTADGYTIHDCDNCDYSYTDAYVEALGHSYETGEWTWEANGNKATLTLVCEHDETHTTALHVISTMEKEVEKGACSNYVIRTHTATVEYNGVTYTDVMVIRQGNPTHNFSSAWKTDGEEHWHECVCGEKTDVSAHTFGDATITKDPTCNEAGESTSYCTICGEAKVTAIPATGEHNYVDGFCDVCGTEFVDAYYVNLINSWKNIDGFAIKIQDFSYEVKGRNNGLVEELKLLGSIKQLDIAELALYVENGEIGGAATGSIVIFNGPISNANAVYKFKAVISEGYVYISVEYGKDTADKTMNMKISVDALIEAVLEEMGIEGDAVYVLEFFKDAIIPTIDTIIELNVEEANAVFEDAFNMIFTFEQQADGSYIATLDYDKLNALNDNLATKPVAEVIDIYFGEGAFADIVDLALEILNLEISEIPAYLDKNGISSEDLFAKINELAVMTGAPDGYDIAEMLKDEEVAGVTLGMLIFEVEDNSYVEELNGFADVLHQSSLYELIDADSAEEIKEGVKAILDMIAENISVSFATGSTGMLASINLEVDNFVYSDEDNEMSLNFKLDVIINGRIEVTWSDIIEQIENSIVLPDEEMLEEGTYSNYDYGYGGYVVIDGKEYRYSNGIRVNAYTVIYDKLTYVFISPDCNDWTAYESCYAAKEYRFTLAPIEIDGEEVVVLIDNYSGEVVKLLQTETGMMAVFENGTEKEIVYDFSVTPDNIAQAYTEIYLAIFENPEGRLEHFGDYVEYYFNHSSNEFSDETHHEYEYEYEVHGESCNDGGCTVRTTCKHCDYHDEYTRYWCDIEYGAEIDLSEHSTCGGTINVDRCVICGYIRNINDMSINCNMSDAVEEEITDAEGNVIGKKYIYTCHDCGLVFIDQEWIEYHSACEYTEYEGAYIYKGEECIFAYGEGWYSEEHEYEYSYETESGDCNDSYKVIEHCKVCGKTNEWWTSGHISEEFTINLADHNGCAGTIYGGRCVICGEVIYLNEMNIGCNINGDATPDEIVGEDGITRYVMTMTCPDCGLKFVAEMWTISESVCVTHQYEVTRIYSGDDCIFEYTNTNTSTDHQYEDIYELEGETCEDGYKVTRYCTGCGDSHSWWSSGHKHGHFEMDWAEHGGCSGTLVAARCDVCGMIADIKEWGIGCELGEAEPVEVVDENGLTHYVTTQACPNCGLIFVIDAWITVESVCVYEEHALITVYSGENVIFEFEESYTRANHEYEISYEMDGDDCEDGYYVNKYCPICGETDRYRSWGHQDEWHYVDLGELGLCGGEVEERYCTICGTVLYCNIYENCNWEYVEENAEGYGVYECKECGATKLVYSHDSEKDEKCQYIHTEIQIYIVNGEEVYRNERTYTSENHNYKYAFEMNGASCTDGYTIITTCEDCDIHYKDTSSRHDTYIIFVLDDKHECCDEHYLEVRSCPCGYNYYINFDEYTFAYDEERQMYVCENCDLTIAYNVNSVEEGCTVIETTTLAVKIADEVIYDYGKEQVYANHDFTKVDVSVVDGVTYITTSCDKCDTVNSTEILSAVMEQHGGEYYYDYTFTPGESAVYTIIGLANRDTYVVLYKEYFGKLIEIGSNDDGGQNGQFYLQASLEAGTTYIYRISFYGQDEEGVINFALTQGAASETVCQHDSYTEFSALLGGSESCEDGALCGRMYTACGCLAYVSVENQHRTVVKDRVSLSTHGACCGEFVYYSCACGQEHGMDLRDACCDEWTGNEYYDEEGRLIRVEVRTCSECGLRYTRSYYTVKDRASCTLTYYYTVVINVGASLVAQMDYTVVLVDHDYEITGTLMGGNGSSCEDGVVITHKCRDCAHEESYETDWHETYEKEHIVLSELGSLCGGYATVYGCACGERSSLSLDHSLCELGSEWCELWIEDAITQGQYTINGWNDFWYESYLYICAVTDPEACAYKIKYASYWLKDENSCTVYGYETWLFGYNEETGAYAYEVTFKTGSSMVYHNYVNGSTDNHVKYDCPDCGSYYYENYYYDEVGNCTKHETLVSNTLDNGHDKYYEYVEEYAFDADGNSYVSREYYKRIYSNGSEAWHLREEEAYAGTFGDPGRKVSYSYTHSCGESYSEEYAYVLYKGYEFRIYYTYRVEGDSWYRQDYTYTFDNGCVQNEVYTNSDGAREEKTNNVCRFLNAVTIKNPTCTQDGEQCSECVVCGKQTGSYTISPHDHNWVQVIDNWYVCFTCGLENANGVSGDIIMEDLTEAYGNGEYYVVGYYARNNVEFSQYVSLILADGTEVAIWSGIEFITIDGIRAFAFAKAAVEAWATENGYTDYDVRFSFVPVGSDGSFDYGVTFTEPTVVTEAIVDNVSFTDYIGAGETKSYTITPTEDGVWTFTSFTDGDTFATLCDINGNVLDSNDDDGQGWNFRITYELKAGETYIIQVRWLSEGDAETMALLFGTAPVIA